MRLQTSFVFLLLILASLANSKRSRGRSRGSSGGSTSFWTRKNKSGSGGPEPKPAANQAKPSAPKEPEVKKETAKVQENSAPNSRPIGWNVDNSNVKASNVHPSYSAPNPHNAGGSYPHNTGGYPGYGHAQPSYPNQQSYGYGAPGGYSGVGHAQPNYPNQHNYGYGAPGGYPGYGHAQANYPNNGYPGNNYGQSYNPQHAGYGQPGQYGGYGNYPHQSQTGLMGSGFGGNKQGYGGFGGYGGYGSGYGMKKSGGFFGKHAFRNVLGGLFVWYLVSGLVSKPYKVYNYYNLPKEQREEITLPSNVLALCNENATSICVPGTTAICTQDNKILCVVTMSSATPCSDNRGELCINSTITCVDLTDPLCQNKTTADNTTTVNVPCFTNMTLDKGSLPPNVTVPTSESGRFCVTTMAEPDPSLPPTADGKTGNQTNTTDLVPPPYNMAAPYYAGPPPPPAAGEGKPGNQTDTNGSVPPMYNVPPYGMIPYYGAGYYGMAPPYVTSQFGMAPFSESASNMTHTDGNNSTEPVK